MIQLKTKELVAPVFAPKVLGTLALQSALEDLDFFVVFSTSLALTGVFGQVDYCAANAFLDAFAHANTHTLSIDWHVPQWETWQEESLASVPEFQAQFAETRAAYGIKLDEGVELFRRLLSSSQPQVIVSTQDFQALIDEQQRAASMSVLDQLQTSVTVARTRTEADGDYVPPQNKVEAAMAALWEELFGLQRLSVNDNFFELGGNSLLGIQLISRVRKDFQIADSGGPRSSNRGNPRARERSRRDRAPLARDRIPLTRRATGHPGPGVKNRVVPQKGTNAFCASWWLKKDG
jgi:hypothetical protein